MLVSIRHGWVALDGYLVCLVPLDDDGCTASTTGRSYIYSVTGVVLLRHVTNEYHFLTAVR